MRWIMALGDRTRPNQPNYAEDTSPEFSRAVALVDDFSALFPIMSRWVALYGEEFTAWAHPTDATDIENLPTELLQHWHEFGPDIRLDRQKGGHFNVLDYRPEIARSELRKAATQLIRC
jgi:hypothetical protein